MIFDRFVAGQLDLLVIHTERTMFKDNIKPDFGWTAPFDSRKLEDGPVECKDPDFADKYMHRMALMKDEHFGSPGDRDENGLPGWSVKKICNGCGREFGDRVFYPDGLIAKNKRAECV